MYFVIHDSAGRLREGRCFHNVWVHPQSIAWSVCVLGLRKGSSRRSAAGILDFDISRSKTVLRNMCVDESFWPPIPISAELSATISTARLLKRNEFAFYLNADSNNPQPWFHTSNSEMVSSLSSNWYHLSITVSQKKIQPQHVAIHLSLTL